jgi:hypothetical protein
VASVFSPSTPFLTLLQGNPIVYLDMKLGRYGEGTPLGAQRRFALSSGRCVLLRLAF